MPNKEFAAILREKRKAAGYNQTQVSAMLFLSRSTYNHFESGIRIPSIDVLIRISALYHINPMELINSLIPIELEKQNPAYVNYIREPKYTLSAKELQFISCLSSLNDEEADAVLHIINTINKAHAEIH